MAMKNRPPHYLAMAVILLLRPQAALSSKVGEQTLSLEEEIPILLHSRIPHPSSHPSMDGFTDIPGPICDDKHSSRYDPLACWLWKVKIAVPDQSFKKSHVTVTIQDLSCSNFVVNSIDSVYIPSNRSLLPEISNPSITLSVKGISASCTGKYHATGGAGGDLSLTATNEDDQPAIHLTSDFVSSFERPNSTSQNASKYWMPSGLLTHQCEANLKISSLHCKGSASAEIFNLFSGMIRGKVSAELNAILCPTIQEAVDPLATNTISSAVRALTKYLPGTSNRDNHSRTSDLRYLAANVLSISTKTKQQSTSATLDLERDTPMLVNALVKVNSFLDCYYGMIHSAALVGKAGDKHIPKGVNCTSLVTKGLTGLLSTVLDAVAEEVHVPIPKPMHSIDFEIPMYGRVLLDIQDLHIAGLDQLDRLSILSPILSNAKNSLLSDFGNRIRTRAGVNVTADVNMTISAIPGGIIHGDPLQEAFHVHLNISSFDASGTVSLTLKNDQFRGIQIGTIMDSLPGIFHPSNSSHDPRADQQCVLDSIKSLLVKDLGLNALVQSATLVPRLQNNSFSRRRRLSSLTEEVEKDLDALINRALMLVLGEYQPLLTDAAAGFVHTALVSKINSWIDTKLKNGTAPDGLTSNGILPELFATADVVSIPEGLCRSDEKPKDTKLVNFTSLASLRRLNAYVNEPSTLASINHAINNLAAKLDKHRNTTITSATAALFAELQKSAIPGVSMKIRGIEIDNLGSIDHIDILSPELDGLHLRNGFSMGVTRDGRLTDDIGTIPRVHASIDVMYRPRNLSGTFNFSLSIGDLRLDGGSLLRFDVARLRRLSLLDILSERHCLMVPFQEHRIYNNHNVSRIGFLVANASVSVVGDSNFQNFTTFMDTTSYPSAASLITDLVGWTMNTLRRGLNSAARSSFEQAEGYCTGGHIFGFDDYPPVLNDGYTDELLPPVLYIFAAIFVTVQIVFVCFRRKWMVPRRENGALSEYTASMGSLLPSGSEVESDDSEKDNSPSEILVNSTVISAFSRQAVPIFIVGTVVLLMSSNMSSGATVDLEIGWGNERTISLPAVFTFSLINTAKDMWNAKIYPLFFLVLIMSGIWPYAKLLLMLGSWLSPPLVLTPKRRERLLLALDALGKFALIDFLLFVLMMVAFRYHLKVSEALSVDVYVSPETGFYSFLAAICFSLVIGHFMVYCHRQSEMRHLSPRQSAIHLRQESVLSHNYVVGYSSEGEQRAKLSRRFRRLVLASTALVFLLLVVGISLKSFKFEVGGIAGDMLGDNRTSRYSLISLGANLRRSVKEPSIGIMALEVTYYFYAVVMPFACLAVLLLLLLCPMTLPTQRRVLAVAEIANAWSAVEVFVIAIIASLLEISTFASFIVGHRCDLIKKILTEYFESAIADDSDATCFTVRSSVEASSCVLVLGALLNSFVVSVLLRFIHCSVAERIEQEMESSLVPHSDDALRSDESHRPETIAGLLSGGWFRGWVFEGVPSPTSRPYGYLPQSTDTYSVTPDVVWEDESTLGGGHPLSPGSPTGPTSESVLRSIRDAFMSVA